jgi:methylmalonyl-CoA mutase N-terminal domain/subunit
MASKDGKRQQRQRTPERRDTFISDSGIAAEPVYTPESVRGHDYDRDSGYPGEYPFTRGIQPNMYRGRLWTMRQYAGYSTPEESNARYRHLLTQGQTGLSIAFDLPTQTGYDSDHEMAQDEVGKVGVPICTLEDMEELLREIPLDQVTTSMTINATAPVLLALYLAVARKQGVALDQVGGTTQNDILKEYIARGTYIYPPEPSLRLTTDLFHFCAERVPKWNTISVSGYHMREAGATAVQELAFTFANATAYVEAALAAGLDIDQFAGRLSFFFAAHNHLFEEAAKFRAARRMWARLMRERFGAKDPRSWMLRFHTQTAGVTLTAQQPDNNVARTTVQALAAVLGGTQSLHVNARDEALALPTEKSATLALRTQQTLAHESGVADTVDPLGGSYYVEHLTDTLEARASEYLSRIEEMGGAVAAIEAGYQRREIEEAALAHQRAVESGERVLVGVNAYETNEPPLLDVPRVDPERARHQVRRLQRVRAERDNAQSEAALLRLGEAARTAGANTMPPILECVEAYATLGEICDTLREVFGEHIPSNRMTSLVE